MSAAGNERLFDVAPKRDDVAIGTLLAGSYRITGLLGVGAMGKVFRAEVEGSNTAVAIKVLRRSLSASKEAVARFRREAFVGVKLLHPNCVGISDFGEAEGCFYIVMEVLEGESLGELLDRERRLPWRRALAITRHLLRGLEHAHGESIVHRDIKPDNIFVMPQEGDPDFARILDFGIAKLLGDVPGAAITAAGITVGTPNYIAPEQATGGTLDGRCDLYSLSVVLYEMLAGTPPFPGRDPMKTVLAHATEVPPTFAVAAPDVSIPAEVEALVRAGLAKKPANRIASASDYLARIDELLVEEPVIMPAVEPAPVVITPPRPRRGRVIALAIAAVIAAIATLAVMLGGSETHAAVTPPDAMAPPSPMTAEVTAAIHTLESGKTCAQRLAAVQQLAALGDARAIPALREARARPRNGKNTNACLTSAVDDAISALTGR